jgi:hypothetical protein
MAIDTSNQRVGVGTITPTVPLDVSGAVNISSNLAVDTNTLFVNAGTNRVGVGKATPTTTLDVSGTIQSGTHLPTENEIYDLGAAGNRWRNLYLSTSTIYMGPQTTIKGGSDGSVTVSADMNVSGDILLINGNAGKSVVGYYSQPSPTVLPGTTNGTFNISNPIDITPGWYNVAVSMPPPFCDFNSSTIAHYNGSIWDIGGVANSAVSNYSFSIYRVTGENFQIVNAGSYGLGPAKVYFTKLLS